MFYLIDKRNGQIGEEVATLAEANTVAEDFFWFESAVPLHGSTHKWQDGEITTVPLPVPPPVVIDPSPGPLDVIGLLMDKAVLTQADVPVRWRQLMRRP